ncbi:unnamed protein product [Neospora caninum Liverpool]|uniref:AP2 domain transcription factor AP2IX-1 n=1 Tax=Neospora caninum (strain Liverpool) TaxID=572307 RepID=F0VAP2_NEOCL|nr:uncharacterized protein NCLIV_038720 [Neospora caninum Liverpool]CBZ50797.1 unnamed protein product [Neospora caninum Liverpool]CEL68098.1 TPA: AP2 domain transcription factor AP2IX-1 [Neospora caninum Liverpool]|eukprot:XP_003880830.1 uncharacterized protein NCLIV_038720 [Neospora caninum Liverpool]
MREVVFSQGTGNGTGVKTEEMAESAVIGTHDDGLPKNNLDLLTSDDKRKGSDSGPRSPKAADSEAEGLQEAACPASESLLNGASADRTFTSTLLALSLAAPKRGLGRKDQGLDCVPGVKLSKAECAERISPHPNSPNTPNVLAEECGYPRKLPSDTSTSSEFTGNGDNCMGSNTVSRLQTGDGAWCPLNSLLETAAWAASSESGDKKCSERLTGKLVTPNSTTTPRGAPDYSTSIPDSKAGRATPDTTTGGSADKLPSSPDGQDSLGRLSKGEPSQRMTGDHTLRHDSRPSGGTPFAVSTKEGRRIFLEDGASQFLENSGSQPLQVIWALLTEAKEMLRDIAAVQQGLVEAQQQLTLLHKNSVLGTGLPLRASQFRRAPSTLAAVDDRGNRDVRAQLELLASPDQLVDWDESDAFTAGALATACSGDVNVSSTHDLTRIARESANSSKSSNASQPGSEECLQHLARARSTRTAARLPSPHALEAVLSSGENGQRHLGLERPSSSALRSSSFSSAESFSANLNGVGALAPVDGSSAAPFGQPLLAPIFSRGRALDKHDCVEEESQLAAALKKRARPRGPNWTGPEGIDKARSALRLTLPPASLYQGSVSADEVGSRKSMPVELGTGGHLGDFPSRTKRKAGLITEQGLPDSPSKGDDGEDCHGVALKQPSPQSAADLTKSSEPLQCLARMTAQKKMRPAWPREDAPMPGVRFAKDRNSWVAFWCENGKQNYKSFSNKKFGCERARLMAIAARHAFDQRVARQQLQQYQQQLNEQHQLKQLHSKKQSRSLVISRPATENPPGGNRAVAGLGDLTMGSVSSRSLSTAGLSDDSARQEANTVPCKRTDDPKANRSTLTNRQSSFDDDSADMLGKAALGLSFAELQKLAESLEIPQHLYSPHHNVLQTTELPSAADSAGLTVSTDILNYDFGESKSDAKKRACLQLEKISDVNIAQNLHLANSYDPKTAQEDMIQSSEPAERLAGRNLRRGSGEAVKGDSVPEEKVRDSAILA